MLFEKLCVFRDLWVIEIYNKIDISVLLTRLCIYIIPRSSGSSCLVYSSKSIGLIKSSEKSLSLSTPLTS